MHHNLGKVSTARELPGEERREITQLSSVARLIAATERFFLLLTRAKVSVLGNSSRPALLATTARLEEYSLGNSSAASVQSDQQST